MPKAYGKAKKDALCAAYRRLESVPKAADSVGVSDGWAYGILKERGLYQPAGRYKPQGVRYLNYNGRRLQLLGRHGPQKVRRVLDDYEDGGQPQVLAEKHDVSVSTIEKWTDRAGIQRTRKEAAANRMVNEGRISPVAAAHIAERLYVEEQQSIGQIADHLDCHNATVLDYLDKRGVETRSQAEAMHVHWHGSLQEYRAFCRRAARLYHAEGMTKRDVCDEMDCCHRTLNRALASEHNPYREGAKKDWSWMHTNQPGKPLRPSEGLTARSVSPRP